MDINEGIEAAIEYLDDEGNIVETASVIETASSSGWQFATWKHCPARYLTCTDKVPQGGNNWQRLGG